MVLARAFGWRCAGLVAAIPGIQAVLTRYHELFGVFGTGERLEETYRWITDV
jgi:hypothetical protein